MEKKLSKEIDLQSVFENNKQLIYSILLYSAGAILGCVVLKSTDSESFKSIIEKAVEINSNNFLSLFLNRLSLYFSIYSVTVLFGMCLIGYPFIWAIPAVTGFIIAFKVSYYYLNYKSKGIGFSLLMVIPEGSALETVLIFTIIKASNLSKSIFIDAIKNKDMKKELNLKSYLKSFLLYSIIIVLTALFNAVLTYYFNSLVSL